MMLSQNERTLFGTDGMRGLANTDPMTPEIALQLGKAIAHLFCRPGHRGKIIIGKDTRLSGYMFEQALAAGLFSMGADAYFCGPLPTPGIAFITSSMRADAGVVISASHNPYFDNGIKIFGADGFKLPDHQEAQLEEFMQSGILEKNRATPEEIGKAFRINDAWGRYIVFLKNSFPKALSLEGMRIVVDCANGAAYRVAPAVLQELGATVHLLSEKPNGRNINAKCGALHPQNLVKAVQEHKAQLGIAFDGDADRILFVDERGEILHGDAVLALCAYRLAQKNELKKNTLVATVMSNLGLERALSKKDISLVRTPVGDRYVVEEMRKHGYNLGGEQSGHLIFLDHMTTGDGMIAALQVLAMMIEQEKSLSELAQIFTPYPQVLYNVKVAEKIPLTEIVGLSELITKIEAELKSDGRVLVRYSGTQAEARIMIEGPELPKIEQYAQELSRVITQACGK